MPNQTQSELIKLLASIVTALGMVVLVPLQIWTLSRAVDHGERIVAIEEWTSSFSREGPRYTSKDAERDFGVIMRILDQQDKVIEDHEGRLRIVEKQ